jgi:hypothetical protein
MLKFTKLLFLASACFSGSGLATSGGAISASSVSHPERWIGELQLDFWCNC